MQRQQSRWRVAKMTRAFDQQLARETADKEPPMPHTPPLWTNEHRLALIAALAGRIADRNQPRLSRADANFCTVAMYLLASEPPAFLELQRETLAQALAFTTTRLED